MVGSVRLLVVQPTPFCNLDCDYCYLPDRGDRSRLSFPVLEAAVERVLDSPYFGGEFTLLWHAGEPLMAPIAFYDEATERIRQLLARRGLPPSKIVQSLQTNATVIDAAWCHCFERNGIHVGVSMDGPAFLHYAHRGPAPAYRGIRFALKTPKVVAQESSACAAAQGLRKPAHHLGRDAMGTCCGECWGRPLTLAALALAVLRLPLRGCCCPIPLRPIPRFGRCQGHPRREAGGLPDCPAGSRHHPLAAGVGCGCRRSPDRQSAAPQNPGPLTRHPLCQES